MPEIFVNQVKTRAWIFILIPCLPLPAISQAQLTYCRAHPLPILLLRWPALPSITGLCLQVQLLHPALALPQLQSVFPVEPSPVTFLSAHKIIADRVQQV